MAADAKLPTGSQLTPLDPEYRECPHRIFDRLREADPVHEDREFGRLFLTRFEDVHAVVSNRMLSSDPRKAPPGSYHRRAVLGDTPVEQAKLSMLHLDGADHARLRGLVVQAFNQRAAEAARPRIRAIATRLLDDLAGRAAFDVVAGYASPLPIMVIAGLLGVAEGDFAEFKQRSDARTQLFNPLRTPAQNEAVVEAQTWLNACFLQMIEERRRQPRDDLVSRLVAAEEAGERLTALEIALICNLLLVAGNVTTTDLISAAILALLENPDQLARLRADPGLAPALVEETLRYDPPVAYGVRVATAPLEIGDVTVPEGTTVTPCFWAAGHDPVIHADPHRFDIDRAEQRHLAFGGGAHFCLGAPLGRAQAQIAIPLFFERFPAARLDPQHRAERKRLPAFNGLETLRLRVA